MKDMPAAVEQYPGQAEYLLACVLGAVQNNNVQTLRDALSGVSNLHFPELRRPLLVLAAGYGRVDVAEMLLDHGAPLEAEDLGMLAPLAAAAQGGNIDMVTFLAARGADLEHGCDLLTPAILAAKEGKAKVLRDLLRLGADPRACNRHGQTAMMLAASRRHLDCVKLLHAAGVSLEDEDLRGNTALHHALSIGGSDGIFDYLIEQGADIFKKNTDGETVLVTTARNGATGTLKKLVALGLDVNETSKSGDTPLMWSASIGAGEAAAFLLDHGADAGKANHQGVTARDIAQQRGYDKIVSMVDINIKERRQQELQKIDIAMQQGATRPVKPVPRARFRPKL